MATARSLVIVESPAKARTIAGFLGDGFVVESSIGHIRDLPKRASDIPAQYKKSSWARLGVDVENDFQPLYVVDPDKKSHIQKLKDLLKGADELFLATDEDREGESIAWHLLEVLKPKVPVKRMVFHEITRRAIEEAIEHPRELDRRLVDAQEARRILDRLYGYEVSPVLWKKVMPKLSAGRVQSVATRIIVAREQERMAFRSAQYWGIDGTFSTKAKSEPGGGKFEASLLEVDGKRVVQGKDFDDQGKLKKEDLLLLNEAAAKGLLEALEDAPAKVQSVERKPNRRSPAAPFMTSTLQQEAGRKLRFTSARTMRAAQRLYENGFITYMRTDSTTLSSAAINSARSQIEKMYGKDYLPSSPRVYKNKVKNAQEAHEAIRPAGDVFKLPEQVARQVDSDEAKLYELIWKRTIASQMADSRGESISVRINAKAKDGRDALFSVSGNTIIFPGFLRAYVEGSDDPAAELGDKEKHLPTMKEGDGLDSLSFVTQGHETQPPARYTEASLVRKLEELGVGRPSTYASIISTIQARGYVWKKGSALVPSFTAFAVVGLLEQHFGDLVDYAFTARMEDELDSIANGDESAVPWLKRFYFGQKPENDGPDDGGSGLDLGLRSLVADQLGEIDARAINSLPIGKDEQGREIVVRVGRYGAYLQREDDRASLPDDLAPDELTLEKATELLNAPSGDRELGNDPETGLPVFVRSGRFGTYVQLGEAGEGKEKPKTGSILKTMDPATMTLADALKVLSLPREVGVGPDDKVITAQLGKFGPYLRMGTDSRSLETEEQVFTVTQEEALKIFAQPRQRGRRAAAPPLKELGNDPVSGGAITLREGRFGPYVTDGETNASLRKDDDPNTITAERAHELLADRRARGPSKKKAKKKTAKKATKKTASKKTASKKTASKKTAKKASKKTAKKASKKTAKKASKKTASGDGNGSEEGTKANASAKPVKKAPSSDSGSADLVG
ncbi:MAG: type I DNA topoisomerase [Myxococcales bacterium]|nr:type I DNA topoisomerase [Myxococcales bacterium]